MQELNPADEHFMRAALAEARLAATEGEVPIGAVVVYKGNIIARAHNRRELDRDPSAHAEFSAMTIAARTLGRWRLTGCTVYVTLEPCLMCAGLMINARIDRCVFGAFDPKGGAAGTLYDVSRDPRLNHEFEVTAGVLEDECSELLRTFFANLRSKRRERQAECIEEAGSSCAGNRAPAPALPDATFRAASAELPRFLLAVDSFKGSATSDQAESWLAEGIRRTLPDASVTLLSIADGGEGTLAAVQAVRSGELCTVSACGPMGAPVKARYLLTDSGKTAIIETAQAAGLALSPATLDAALAATTYGVGELLRAAAANGAQTIYLGLGGSATSDGGTGMLQALGARLTDAAGSPLRPGLDGLRDIAHIDLAPARKTLAGIKLIALTDVTNPLVGPHGAIRVFGPQKGLSDANDPEATLAACDRWMCTYAAHLSASRDALDGTPLQVAAQGKRPASLAAVPGAGAAGGLGAALLALGAQIKPGIDAILELARFDELARQADIVVTGEGSLDDQTAAGKAPVGVARRTKAVSPRTPVVAVCGARADDLDSAYRAGIDLALPICRKPLALGRALSPEEAHANLICTGETIARLALLLRR